MFTRAIVRKPGRNFAEGITTSGLGRPDYRKALEQHGTYCDALARCGLQLTVLEADEMYPDGCFVEDTAIITKEVAIIARPGAESRKGEEDDIFKVISRYKGTERIESPGTLDGGDILRAENHFYIGLSGRTNREGAVQLSRILAKLGYSSSEIEVGEGLHLKSGIAYLGEGNYISIREYSNRVSSSGIIVLNEKENYSANCLRVNDWLLIPKGYPDSKKKLSDLGYRIIEIDTSEFRKMDGGLTCLSLLF